MQKQQAPLGNYSIAPRFLKTHNDFMGSARVAIVVVAVGVLVYIANRLMSEPPPAPEPQTQVQGEVPPETTAPELSPPHAEQNPDMNFNTPDAPSQSAPGLPVNKKIENSEEFVDNNPYCPIQTSKYREVIKCPFLPGKIKIKLKNLNYSYTQEECEIESKTVNITLGKKFIAWTLIQSNSCENKAFPNGLPEEKTYVLKDATEIHFADHFKLYDLEQLFRKNANFSAGIDEQGNVCPPVKSSNRRINLGSLESELTKAQFRFVDKGTTVSLEMQSFFPAKLGRICSLRMRIPNWRPYLYKTSSFQKNQKPNAIFTE